MPVDHVQRAAGVAHEHVRIDLQHDRRALAGAADDVCRATRFIAQLEVTASAQRHADGTGVRPKHGLDGMGADGSRGKRAGKHWPSQSTHRALQRHSAE